MSNYEEVVKINARVVGLVTKFQDKPEQSILLEIFTLLEAITLQEIRTVLENANLPRDLADDMKQDAYLHLWDVVNAFDIRRSPVFISYWRTAIRNHLVGKYSKQWRHRTTPEGLEKEYEDLPTNLFLLEIKELCLREFSTWENEAYRNLATKILMFRILVLPIDRTTQQTIADEFKITQSQVSHWEKWLRKQILTGFKDE